MFNKIQKSLKKSGNLLGNCTFVDATHIIRKNKLWEERDKAIAKKYSTMDISKYGKQIRKIKINNNWYTSEITAKMRTFFKNCNLTIP